MLLSVFLRAVFAEVSVFNLVEVLAAEPQSAAVALIAPDLSVVDDRAIVVAYREWSRVPAAHFRLPSNGIVIVNSALSGWTNRCLQSLAFVFCTMSFHFLQ